MSKLIYCISILISTLMGRDLIQLKKSTQECNVTILASDDYQTLLEFDISGFYRNDTIISGQKYNNIEVPGTGWRLTPGLPLLPAIYKLIAIPSSKDVKLTIIEKKDTLLSDYYLIPSPSINPDNPDTFIINEDIYNFDGFFPDSLTAYYGPALWRDCRVLQLKVYPVQFNPVKKEIRIITKLKLKVEYIGENRVNDPTRPLRPTKTFAELYKKYILNYEEYIKERTEWEGSYLIIVHDNFYEACLPFFSWKSRLGYNVVIKPLSEIGYDSAAIYDYIKHAYDEWTIPLEYVLLIGDDNFLPTYRCDISSYSQMNGIIPSDLVYSCVSGNDYLPDILVGRFSIGSNNECTNMRSKIMNYESGTIGGDWYKRETGICVAGNGQEESQYAIGFIRRKLLANGFIQADSLCVPHNDVISSNINNGRNFVVYHGHGSYQRWSPYQDFTVEDVLSLNNNVPSIVNAISCLTNDFTLKGGNGGQVICMGEAFTCFNKGAVSYWGATNLLWIRYSDILDIGFFEMMFETNIYNLGSLCDGAKFFVLNVFGANDTTKAAFYLMNLLGDPSLQVWTDIPMNFYSVEWSSPVEWNGTYKVGVFKVGHQPFQGALACVWNKQGWPDEIHLTGYTGADGYAYLGPIPSGFYEGPANLTVLKHNYRPVLKDINIVALRGPYYLTASSPSMISVKLNWNDFSGREVGFIIARKVDDGSWNNNWKDIAQQNLSQYVDNDVQFGHKYTYMVRCYDAGYQHFSTWSNEISTVCGSIALSGSSGLSAFNNGPKVVKYGNNVHVVYRAGSDIKCLYSTDGGLSFTEESIAGSNYITNPVICLSGTGTPYIIYGQYNCVYSKGTEDPGWHLQYLVKWLVGTSWDSHLLYDFRIDINPNNPPPDTNNYLSPPSFTMTDDSGYVAFTHNHSGMKINVVRFPLSNPASSHDLEVIASPSMATRLSSIGYDTGGRIVVLVHDYDCGPLVLWWRAIASIWHNIQIPNFSAYGSPSLQMGQNEFRITMEGWKENTNQEGLFFLSIPWQSSTYNVNQTMELVNTNFDYDLSYGIEGYSCLAGKDLVLWKYLDDIWYSQRIDGAWSPKQNITSPLSDISSYPQGIVFGGAIRQKLYAIWTEKLGSNYYLIRKIINLPLLPNQSITQIAESSIPDGTGYNNARRLLKDNQENLHLVFTSENDIYHTFHNVNDTSWSEAIWIGEGKYPALSLGPDGNLYCVWNYHGYQEFDGVPYFVEYLRMRSYNGISWSKPTKLLFHTYGTYLWGVGAPSLATNDSMAYVTFKSYHGPTFNPVPGEPYPHIVVVEGPALICGKFPLNNSDAYTYQIIDTIIKNPNPVDTSTYRDSLIPLLISPSITVDMAGVPHILWEGDSTAMRYYSVDDSIISRQIFDSVPDIRVDYPSLIANNDQVQLLWAANDSIKYRYGWANTENLSQPISIAACENPISSGQYLAWTQHDGCMSHLYYGAIPSNGSANPIEVNYSTDIISYPQILFNLEKQNQISSLDLVWSEYSQLDSLGYIYYINLPLAEEAPIYSFDMGTEIPVPVLVQRDGFLTYGSEDFKTVDYDSTELIYHLALHSPHKKYRIKWSYYHQELSKIKLDFSIDNIFHHNRWINPYEQVTQETWIPDSCLVDNEITIKVNKNNGSIAVLSGFEIYERIVGGGGPQGTEAILSRPFSLERIFPNPAKSRTRIRFNSPDERLVSIKLYDISGRLAYNLLNGKAHTGINEISLKTGSLSSGIYFMKIETKGYSKVEKLILLK